MRNFVKILIAIVIVVVIGVLGYLFFSKSGDDFMEMTPFVQKEETKLVNFSEINSQFNFSAKIPSEFEAEYVTSLRSINVYNPNLPGESFDSAQDRDNIEKSQLYITYFNADRFLTLNTVDIIGLEKMAPGGREAILYTITKKTSVPNFSGQPGWRNFTHKALDIRISKDNPSIFYSFAYNPEFGEKSFNNFINSLEFK